MKKVFEYRCHVEKPGYEVIGARYVEKEDGEASEGLIEPMLSLRGGHGFFRRYEYEKIFAVNDFPSLFMDFAQMEKTPEAVEAFANAFGTLNVHDVWNYFRLEHDTSKICAIVLPEVQSEHIRYLTQPLGRGEKAFSEYENYYPCFAEPLRLWYAEIDQLRTIIELWQSLTHSDKEAKGKIQTTINDKIKAKVTPKLFLDSLSESLELVVYPDNLISALWLQLALAVDGRKAYKQCQNCQNWFEVGKWGSRIDRKYCGDSCKQAVYDAKKRAKSSSLTH